MKLNGSGEMNNRKVRVNSYPFNEVINNYYRNIKKSIKK